ncbi:hypothetical protein EJB05_29853 [Eragrostis curvula]|uniref:Uncharacterized protein n=1 Tax=Eragrostis curvula TaxID=38414 RepID=A0A5J9UUM7_9POAL|nr:hypothetical protein EJB05_29853 [Eragrostis curvula]
MGSSIGRLRQQMFHIHEVSAGSCLELSFCFVQIQLILLAVWMFSFPTAAMASVHIHSFLVHKWGVPFISKQAAKEKNVPCEIWVLIIFVLGLLYSKENRLVNKVEDKEFALACPHVNGFWHPAIAGSWTDEMTPIMPAKAKLKPDELLTSRSKLTQDEGF